MTEPLPLSELSRKLNAMCAGELSDEDAVRVAELLREDSRARRFYIQFMDLHAALQWQVHDRRMATELPVDIQEVAPDDSEDSAVEISTAELLAEVMEQERVARIKRQAEVALEKQQQADSNAERRASMRRLAGLSKPDVGSQTRHYVIPKPIFYGSIAAVIAVILIVLWPQERHQQNPVEPTLHSLPAIATVREAVDAEWSQPQQLTVGADLHAESYSLQRGIVKLLFNSRAEVILEAPASFTLHSSKTMTLTSGKLVGICRDAQSKGFVVHTPGGRVIDYGTVFGVSVDDANKTLTHVFEGEVELASADTSSPPIRLTQDEAASVRPGGPVIREASSVNAFIREVPTTAYQIAVLRSRPMCFWSGPVDETTSLLNDFGWLDVDGRAKSIHGASQGHIKNDESGSLDFGTREQAYVIFPAHKEFVFDINYSIEAWCWVQPGQLKYMSAMRVVSTRSGSGGGIGFGIHGGDPFALDPGQVPSKPIFTFFGKTDIFGLDTIPEGEWFHFVAVVDDRRQVSMYINGVQTPVRSAAGQQTDQDTSTHEAHDSLPLMIGRNPYSGRGKGAWKGRLDEVAIYDRPLTENEIRNHYEIGRRP